MNSSQHFAKREITDLLDNNTAIAINFNEMGTTKGDSDHSYTISNAKHAIQAPQREIEALIGVALLTTLGAVGEKIAMKKSKLVPKEVHLPQCNYTMHYLEREALPLEGTTKKSQHTILFFHGISGKMSDFAGVVANWDIPSHIRILIPEQMAHGKDIERARLEGDNFKQPTQESLLASASEFLDEVKAGDNCNVFGISMGGAAAYYLHHKRPDKIKRTVLVSPAIPACIDKTLVNGILDGTNNFFCLESRTDVKLLMRDLSTGRNDTQRKKKDPVPKFFNEAIYRLNKKSAPDGHKKAMLLSLLESAGFKRSGTTGHEPPITAASTDVEKRTNPFSAVTDIDGNSHRLVMWPDKDQIVNYEQGNHFFEDSTNRNTEFETISDCGHVFHADGTSIMELIRPKARAYLLEFNSLSAA